MYTRFFLQLNQFPKLIMLSALVISFFFFDQVRQKLFDQSSGDLIIDSTVEPFIERSSGAYREFLEVRDAFGNEDVLVVALCLADPSALSPSCVCFRPTLPIQVCCIACRTGSPPNSSFTGHSRIDRRNTWQPHSLSPPPSIHRAHHSQTGRDGPCGSRPDPGRSAPR